MSISAAFFVLENLAIWTGYAFAAIRVVPVLPIKRKTEIAGYLFFATCGLTHFEHMVHALTGESVPLHTHLWHLPQAFAIWAFLHWFRHDIGQLVARTLRAEARTPVSNLDLPGVSSLERRSGHERRAGASRAG